MKNLKGKFLGKGNNRTVWEYQPDPSFVIKQEHSGIRANLDEIETFEILSAWNLAEHLAPCEYDAESESIIMQKGSDLPSGRYSIPGIFPYENLDNFKLLEDRIVLVDYDWRLYTHKSRLYWVMPRWDFSSISDCAPSGLKVEQRNFSEALRPGEAFTPPQDQTTTKDSFVRIPFERHCIVKWFDQTRTIQIG